jgi:hypothetical protein
MVPYLFLYSANRIGGLYPLATKDHGLSELNVRSLELGVVGGLQMSVWCLVWSVAELQVGGGFLDSSQVLRCLPADCPTSRSEPVDPLALDVPLGSDQWPAYGRSIVSMDDAPAKICTGSIRFFDSWPVVPV